MIQAKLTHSNSVDAPPMDVSFPIRAHANVYRTLANAGIGDVCVPDCHIVDISGRFTVLSALKGQDVNVDELDYLAKRLESFSEPEARQFEGVAAAKGVTDIERFINLTFCCWRAVVISDFSDLQTVGKARYLSKNAGAASMSALAFLDAEGEAVNLIRNESGVITPYGVVYAEGVEIEPVYQGLAFPPYLYDPCVLAVEAARETWPAHQNICLYLPMPDVCLERELKRGGLRDSVGIRLNFEGIDAPSNIFRWVEPASETLASLNEAAKTIAAVDGGDMDKLCAAVEYVKPNRAGALKKLAENIGLFRFYPGIATPEEYGRRLITASGCFEDKAEALGFFDFDGYGKMRIEREHGVFLSDGYICCRDLVALDEMMANAASKRLEPEALAEAPPGWNLRMEGM
jgi:hypothetical protein